MAHDKPAQRSHTPSIVTKLGRPARSLLYARDIVEELNAAVVKLNIGGSLRDPNGRRQLVMPAFANLTLWEITVRRVIRVAIYSLMRCYQCQH